MIQRMILLLAAVSAVAAVATAGAGATAPEALTIEVWGTLSGPSSVDGRWVASGLFQGSGTYHEDFRFAGESIHVVKTFVSPEGTFVLKAQTLYSIAPDGTVTFASGSWQIVAATGAYEGLHAGGEPAVTADSFGSLATGAVHGVHLGSGHFE